MLLTKIFVEVDDFCKEFVEQYDKNLLTNGSRKRDKKFAMSPSEIITILIWYHHTDYKTFKNYYNKHVLVYMKSEFHELVSYNRFLELRSKVLSCLCLFLHLRGLSHCSGISIIDSFSLNVCHNLRIRSNKVFKGVAERGKTSVGWFYGFKVHVVINHAGEIISFYITKGNVADNNEKLILKLTQDLFGKLIGDKGYLLNEKLFRNLYMRGLHVITKAKKNMRNRLMPLADKLLLRKRGAIESVGAILKEGLSMEHSRHRSVWGFFAHIISTLIAYNFKEHKPSIAQINNQAQVC